MLSGAHKPSEIAWIARDGDVACPLRLLRREASMMSVPNHRLGRSRLSFEPKAAEPGQFHTLRVAVKDRPDLHVRTREGYWALP